MLTFHFWFRKIITTPIPFMEKVMALPTVTTACELQMVEISVITTAATTSSTEKKLSVTAS